MALGQGSFSEKLVPSTLRTCTGEQEGVLIPRLNVCHIVTLTRTRD